MKNIQFTLTTAAADLERKINQINGYLAKGKEVTIKIKLHGRQMNDPLRATEHLDWIMSRVVGARFKKATGFSGGCVRGLLRP